MHHPTAARSLLFRSLRAVLASALAAGPDLAQSTVVVPIGCANAAGNTANFFPFGAATAPWAGLRQVTLYDASHFTGQGITGPILIDRLRWRADDAAAATAGGTFHQATVRLSTAPWNYTAVAADPGANHGADVTTVFSGPVVHAATTGPAGWTPQSWCVEIVFQTPFRYDPALGDLVVDCEHPGGANYAGAVLQRLDVKSTGSATARAWSSATYPASDGSAVDYGNVVELRFQPAGGIATAAAYGAGCLEPATANVYERFAAGGFDLGARSLRFQPTADGYVVSAGTGAWRAPQAGATPVTLGDESVSAPLPLGFPLAYPGGVTTAVTASSNGFVWALPSADPGCCTASATALGQLGARWCPLWTDLHPGSGGTVQWEQDQGAGAAYLTFSAVPEYGNTFRPNTFQIAFFATGDVEMRWASVTTTTLPILVGWSPGGGSRDPGPIDLSTALSHVTQPDRVPLAHRASARPVLGTTIRLDTTEVPTGCLLGATLFGLAELQPPLDLGPLGMPGCQQHLGIAASALWTPTNGTGSTTWALPSGGAFAGVTLRTQGAALVPGVNAAGALTSNGLRLRLDAN